jgi:choline kinase
LLADEGDGLVLAVDSSKPPGGEAMKVALGEDGAVQQIGKKLGEADGEYIGVALIGPAAAAPLADALEATWRRDPSLYYEDGFQELVARGETVRTAPIGSVDWVEVDDEADLARAREIAWRY